MSNRSPKRSAVVVGRTALALLSAVALTATGYAWATYQKAQNGMSTADVLDPSTSTGSQVKPADGAMDILLVGMDSRTDTKGNPLPPDQLAMLHAGSDDGEVNTDTIILIHIPNDGGQAVGISIPRDSWVQIPGYGTNKINSAYGAAKAAALRDLRGHGVTDPAQLDVQSNQEGAKEVIRTVEGLTGVTIDHFASVNLEGFYQISNAIGGVPVCLKAAVDDTKWSGAKFPQGQFTVQGVQALEFVRQRHNIPGGSTDVEREQRQQAFLASMAHKVLSGGVLASPSQLGDLITAIQGAITIDNHWNLVDFAQQMAGMSSGNIKFETMPVVNIDYWPLGQGTGKPNAVKVDPAQVSAFVHGQTGVPATPASSTGTPPPASPNAAVTVDVNDASGHAGLTDKVLAAAVGKGFTAGTTGTATRRATSTVIRYSAGQLAAAQAVRDALGGSGYTLTLSASVPAGHVIVDVGRGYDGATATPGGQGTPTPPAGNTPATGNTATPPPTGASPPISDNGSGPPCVN